MGAPARASPKRPIEGQQAYPNRTSCSESRLAASARLIYSWGVPDTAPAILQIGLLLVLAAAAGKAARLIHMPAVVGYLGVGLAVSPFTPGYVADRQQVSLLANIGVVLLLFEVAIEIDPVRLAREASGLLWAVPLQLGISLAGGIVVAVLTGIDTAGAVLIGLALSMSSTVVVLNVTRSARRTTDPSTETTLVGWSILQDLIGVTASVAVVAIFGLGGVSGWDAGLRLIGFVVLAAVVGYLLPFALRQVRREHDLFLLASVASGLLLAGVGARVFGVPLALAAFVSGLVITESPIAAEVRQRILPFRDLFAVMFFVSLGTVLDPGRMPAALPWFAGILALLIGAKIVPIWAIARLAQLPGRPLQVAMGLGQVGEFTFVLAGIGVAAGILSREVETALLAIVVLSVAVSSVLVRLVHPTRAPMAASG